MSEKQEKAIAKKDETAIAALGEKELADLGNEFGSSVQVRRDILKIPALKLGNALSPAVQGGLAKQGEFFCEIKDKKYGTEVTVAVLRIKESASLMEEKGNKVICSSDDLIHSRDGHECANCPYNEYWADWGDDDNPKQPKCSASIDVTCLVANEDGEFDDPVPEVISFRKTNNKAGRKLAGKIVYHPHGIPFEKKYVLKSFKDKKDRHTFYAIDTDVRKLDMTIDELKGIIPIAKKVKEYFDKGNVVQETDVDEAEAVVSQGSESKSGAIPF